MWDLSEEEIQTETKVYKAFKCCMEKTLGPEMFYLNHQKGNHSRDMSLDR